MNCAPAKFRFAPTPNGELHLGHAYSALLNLKFARAVNARMLLRIEDIDRVRCTPELERNMLEDLEWIGFEWDEEPRRQSEHYDDYRAALEKLKEHKLVYPAFLTRGEIRKKVAEFEAGGQTWPRDPDGSPLYPGEERSYDRCKQKTAITRNAAYSLRLDNAKASGRVPGPLTWDETGGGSCKRIAAKPEIWGDVVLARKDTPTSYHLSCVVDDAIQGISHIVRGLDLYEATSVHRLLQTLLDLPQPEYFHHKLVVDIDGKKLSKSNKDTSLRQLRNAGYSASDIRQKLFEGSDQR